MQVNMTQQSGNFSKQQQLPITIFSLQFFIHFLRYWHGEFVYQSKASFVGDHFLYFCDLSVWVRGDIVGEIWCWSFLGFRGLINSISLESFSIEFSKIKIKVITASNHKIPWRVNESCPKRGKTRAAKSWLFLALLLIGWESGVSFQEQSQSEGKPHQCSHGLWKNWP